MQTQRGNHSSSKLKKRRRVSIRNIISTLLLIFALGVLFYPIVVNYFVAQQNATNVQTYNQAAKNLSSPEMDQLLAKAEVYNQFIFARSQNQTWNQAIPDYKTQLVTDSSKMIGYLTIPQIKVNDVPIYSGDSEETLATGIGHIPQTSLPIGGLNTHAVLSAHSGRVNNTLFSDLQDLKMGDVFYLHVLGKTLKYQINDRNIVDPADVTSLNVFPGKDLVTLVTCWPTGVNNKRLLVTGHRVADNVKLPQEKVQRNQYGYNFWVMLGSGILVLLGILLGLLAFLRRRRHIIRVDRAQFTALQNGSQKMLIAAKKVLDADSQQKNGKSYREGDKIILKVWELATDTENSSYYRQKNSVWEETQSNKAEKQGAELIWLADAADFNHLLAESDSFNLAENFTKNDTVFPAATLAEAKALIHERLGFSELPEDCVLLGIKIK